MVMVARCSYTSSEPKCKFTVDFLRCAFGKLPMEENIVVKNTGLPKPIDPESGRHDTYEYLLRHAIRTAIVMKQKGIKKGDIVMECSDNHLDACIPIVASLFLGAIPCSLNPIFSHLEMSHVISQLKPNMIFAISQPLKLIRNIFQDLKLNSVIVVFGDSDEFIEFQSFIEPQPEENEFEPVVSQNAKETAIIYMSSGTTGLPKTCYLSHQYFFRQSGLMPRNVIEENLDVERRDFEWDRLKHGIIFLNYSPLYWLTGGKIFFENVFLGGTRVLSKKFNPEQFWYLVDKYKVMIVLLGPYYISELIKYDKPPDVSADTLLRVLTSGSSLSVRHCKPLQDILPNADFIQSYGLTETGMIIGFETFNKTHRECFRKDPLCLGFPVKGVWYKDGASLLYTTVVRNYFNDIVTEFPPIARTMNLVNVVTKFNQITRTMTITFDNGWNRLRTLENLVDPPENIPRLFDSCIQDVLKVCQKTSGGDSTD